MYFFGNFDIILCGYAAEWRVKSGEVVVAALRLFELRNTRNGLRLPLGGKLSPSGD